MRPPARCQSRFSGSSFTPLFSGKFFDPDIVLSSLWSLICAQRGGTVTNRSAGLRSARAKPCTTQAPIRIVRGGSKRPRSAFLRLVPTLFVEPVNSRAVAPVSHAISFCRVETTHWFLVTMDSADQGLPLLVRLG